MATTVAAVTPPTLTAEASPSVDPPGPEEPQDLTPLTNHQSDTPPQSQESETLTPAVPSPPLFINSISELKGLSAAITAFQECYEDLHSHLDSIKAAILSKVPPETPQEQNPPKSELEGLCKMMCSRGMRKYLASNLSHLAKLREEVPKALKLAPNPPKLVWNVWAVREEAETAALAWRKRLVFEGGVAKASQIDARGLLLFVACFGVPASFKREDIRDLLIAANAKEIVGVLQKSQTLMKKIPEIVEGMIKNKMEIDAVDIAYTFGLEERFNPQTVLTSFLRESKESWKKPKKGSQNESNKKQLAALKSISKCLERHNTDPAKLLPGWQINEKMATLEKDIAEFDRKSAQKRKVSETETSKKSKTQEGKRSRIIGHGPQQHKVAGHVDSRRNLLDSGLPGHATTYSSSPSVVYGGPSAGLLPESMIQPGVGAGMSASHGGILSAGSYAGVHGECWYAGQPSLGLTSLYRASTSMEGFAGAPNASSAGHVSRGSASDLYQFADSVVESESYPSSVPRNVGGLPTAVPAHHSSYLYQV
ncbi:UNVERIFIED_CONTAM: protein FRIGIDA [Sesamum calycinum]|uniref:FRIGIDA-like protein n=1 Tax=Sesamum calycinum TaxID=2727403 RepID=A0AAW2NGZ9_9LAMI